MSELPLSLHPKGSTYKLSFVKNGEYQLLNSHNDYLMTLTSKPGGSWDLEDKERAQKYSVVKKTSDNTVTYEIIHNQSIGTMVTKLDENQREYIINITDEKYEIGEVKAKITSDFKSFALSRDKPFGVFRSAGVIKAGISAEMEISKGLKRNFSFILFVTIFSHLFHLKTTEKEETEKPKERKESSEIQTSEDTTSSDSSNSSSTSDSKDSKETKETKETKEAKDTKDTNNKNNKKEEAEKEPENTGFSLKRKGAKFALNFKSNGVYHLEKHGENLSTLKFHNGSFSVYTNQVIQILTTNIQKVGDTVNYEIIRRGGTVASMSASLSKVPREYSIKSLHRKYNHGGDIKGIVSPDLTSISISKNGKTFATFRSKSPIASGLSAIVEILPGERRNFTLSLLSLIFYHILHANKEINGETTVDSQQVKLEDEDEKTDKKKAARRVFFALLYKNNEYHLERHRKMQLVLQTDNKKTWNILDKNRANQYSIKSKTEKDTVTYSIIHKKGVIGTMTASLNADQEKYKVIISDEKYQAGSGALKITVDSGLKRFTVSRESKVIAVCQAQDPIQVGVSAQVELARGERRNYIFSILATFLSHLSSLNKTEDKEKGDEDQEDGLSNEMKSLEGSKFILSPKGSNEYQLKRKGQLVLSLKSLRKNYWAVFNHTSVLQNSIKCKIIDYPVLAYELFQKENSIATMSASLKGNDLEYTIQVAGEKYKSGSDTLKAIVAPGLKSFTIFRADKTIAMLSTSKTGNPVHLKIAIGERRNFIFTAVASVFCHLLKITNNNDVNEPQQEEESSSSSSIDDDNDNNNNKEASNGDDE